MKQCQNCGTKNADSSKQCNFCNATLSEKEACLPKENNYVHDEKTEKKKVKRKKMWFVIIGVLILSALVCIFIAVFSAEKTVKGEEIYSAVTSAFSDGNKFSGTLKGKGTDISFEGTISGKTITVTLSGGDYSSVIFSEEGMILTKDGNETKADKSMDCYKLYTAYLLLTSTDKSPFEFKTDDIKGNILPIVKEQIFTEFDEKFIEDNFTGAIAKTVSFFENDTNLETYLNISFPEDVKNGEFSFNISTYDLQNELLKQFKNAFINSADYDKVNQDLKDSKSDINKKYGAEGSFTVEDGMLKTANCDLKYDGVSYNLSFQIN